MSLNPETAGAHAPTPVPAAVCPDPDEDPAGALLQLDFDAPELTKRRSARLEWKSPPASIKEAVARWLDEQL